MLPAPLFRLTSRATDLMRENRLATHYITLALAAVYVAVYAAVHYLTGYTLP